MTGPMALLRAGGRSIAFQNLGEKLPVLEKAVELPCLESQAEREAVQLSQTLTCLGRTCIPLPGVPLAYFNSFLCPAQPPASRIHACEQDQPTILRSAEWGAFQAACEQAAVELTQSLDNFDHSRMKGYLLGEEKKIVQDYIPTGLRFSGSTHGLKPRS